MSFANWAGISNWKVVSDPTSVLVGSTLKAENDSRENFLAEVLIQNIGTSTSFNINNYEIVTHYAFQADSQFENGEFLLGARLSYTGSTLNSFYAAGIKKSSISQKENPQAPPNYSYFEERYGKHARERYNKYMDHYKEQVEAFKEAQDGSHSVVLYYFNGSDLFLLNSTEIDKRFFRKVIRHEMRFSVSGTDIVNLQLTIDGKMVLSHADTEGFLQTGFPAILVKGGTIYVDNFYVNRYTPDGLIPQEFDIETDLPNFTTDAQIWLSNNTGSKSTTSTSDANGNPLSLIDSWTGIDQNTTSATSTSNFRPNLSTLNNFESALFFRTVTTSVREASSNGQGVFYTGFGNGGNVGWYKETSLITGSNDVAQSDPHYVNFFIKFMVASATGGNIYTLFDGAAYTSGAGATQRSVTFGITQDGTMTFATRSHDSSKMNDINYSASAFALDTWYNIEVQYFGSLYDVSLANVDTKVIVRIDAVDQTSNITTINTRNPNMGVDFGSTQSANAIMIMSSDPRSSADTSIDRSFISNFYFSQGSTTRRNIETANTLVSAPDTGLYIPFRLLNTENAFMHRYLKVFDRKGNVNIFSSNFDFAFRDPPTDDASLLAGGSTLFYFGVNYRPRPRTDKPTGATNGSLYFGRTVTETGNRAVTLENSATYGFAEGQAITFSFWIYLDTAVSRNPDRLFTAKSGSTEVFKFNLKQGIKFEVISVDGSSNANTLVYNNYTPNTAGFYNIVLTWNGTAANLDSNVNLYVNGAAQTPSSTTINNNSNPLPTVDSFIYFSSDTSGNDAPDETFIHSIHVFKSVISASSVNSTLYNGGTYQGISNADHQYLFVDDPDTVNLMLDDGAAVLQNVSGGTVSQIANNYKDTGNESVQNGMTALSTVALSGITGGAGRLVTTTTNFPNHLQISHSTNYNFNSSGCSIFILASNRNPKQTEQIVLQKGSSYKVKIKEAKLIFDNGSEFGSASRGIVPQELSIYEIITNVGIFINGSKMIDLAVGTGADNTDDIFIGSDSSTTESTALQGEISEILVLGREVTTEDRQFIEGVFAHEYGINKVLPYNHPYSMNKPYKGDS